MKTTALVTPIFTAPCALGAPSRIQLRHPQPASCFQRPHHLPLSRIRNPGLRGLAVRCAAEDKGDKAAEKVKIVDGANSPPGGVNLSGSDTELEEATKKWGLEYGIFKAFTSKGDNGAPKSDGAKGLLARYGSAYLLTSISLSLVSFSLCYVLVDSGVDVAALLAKVGIQVDSDSSMEQVGTVALAYAAHKAASPIRFPPTVALTPIVARWMGKNMDESGDADAKK